MDSNHEPDGRNDDQEAVVDVVGKFSTIRIPTDHATSGEVAEWPIAPVLKTGVQQCTEGSNPSLSALIQRLSVSLNKTQSVALATGCVSSFLTSQETVKSHPVSVALSRNQPSGPGSGTKTGQQYWPRHRRHSMRFDERFKSARNSGTYPRRVARSDVDTLTMSLCRRRGT